jgi:hypothetical protein
MHCIVDEAELVAFDDGREHSGGVYALGAGGMIQPTRRTADAIEPS